MKFGNQRWLAGFERVHPKLLQPGQASFAKNFRLDSGALEPWKDSVLNRVLAKIGVIKTIYRWAAIPGNESSGFWFHWTQDVNLSRGPINGDTQQRLYYTGDGEPKYTYAGIATSGGGEAYPTVSRPLGVPQPQGQVFAAVTGSPDPDADPIADVVTRQYAIVYVTEKGEFGPAGAFSNRVDVILGQNVNLTNVPTAPSGSWAITDKRIYRLATGSAGTDFYFVEQISITAASYADIKTDADLGEPLLSQNWFAPPADLFGLGITPNGVAYGFSKNQICLSEPYLPHAWDPENQKSTKTEIVGGTHWGDSIIVFDRERAYIVSGIDPRSMSVDEVNNNQACVSKRSIVGTQFGVIYASSDGLFLLRGSDDQLNLTEGIFNETQWRAYRPDSILGVVFDHYYIGFYDNGVSRGGFVISIVNPKQGIMLLSQHATAAYRDPLTDKLYLVVNNNQLVEFNQGSPLSGIWKSGEFQFESDKKISAAKIILEGSVNFRFYVHNSLVYMGNITHSNAFRLPMQRGRNFRYELEGAGKVFSVSIAESLLELN